MPEVNPDFLKEIQTLDEGTLRLNIEGKKYNDTKIIHAREELRKRIEAREVATASRAEERASRAEARAIAAERTARRDSRIAIIAVIVAIIALAHDLL